MSTADSLMIFFIAFFFFLSFALGFGKTVVQSYIDKKGIDAKEDENENRAKYKFEKHRQFILKYIAPVVFFIIAIWSVANFSITAIMPDGIVYYDFSGKYEREFSELEVYKSLGQYEENGVYTEYSLPYLYFVDKDGIRYSSGSLDNEKELEKIEKVFDEKGVTINVIKSEEDIHSATD